MIIRACKIRVGDGIRSGSKVLIVSATRHDFGTTSVFARPIGRSKAHDMEFFVDSNELVEVIRDR